MTQAVPKPQPDASRAMPAIGHLLRGRMRAIIAGPTGTRQHRRATWVTAGRRASVFVVGLQRRHLLLRMGNPAEQVLAAAGAPAVVSAPQQHWHLAYAPRVILQLAGCDRAVPAAALSQGAAAVQERMLQQEGPRFVSTLIERVLHHSERIDPLKIIEHSETAIVRHEGGDFPAAERRAAQTPVAQGRVQRVLRVDQAAATARTLSAGGPSPPQAAAAMRRDAPASEPSPSAQKAPQINIEHLADRVVHAIDRRLLAQRERYGRA